MLVKLVLLLLFLQTLHAEPRVTLKEGTLVGKTLTTRSGRDILAFQGVPYAAPPTGELRFKAPQAVAAWQGELEAKREGNECPQPQWKIMQASGSGHEDCLYLNVYTPTLVREGPGLSVMVWIHGGGFFFGSGNSHMYGPDLLLEHDVILVTFNYRIGALGFLSLGTPEAPGNLGMKDQVAALRWVHDNIDQFGGNPESVTIFGESAGAASVSLLMFSPSAAGLFHRAIAQSGSPLGRLWRSPEQAFLQGLEIAETLNCTSVSLSDKLQCLRSLNFSAFINPSFKSKWRMFLPTLEPNNTEDAFLTEAPRSLLARGAVADVPFVSGLTTHEGLMFLGMLKSRNRTLEAELEDYTSYVPLEIPGNCSSAAAADIKKFYEEQEPYNLTERYVMVQSDTMFLLSVDDMVRGVASLRRSPVFYYQFSYDGGRETIKTAMQLAYNGTAHTDELGYLFSGSDYPTLEAPNDISTAETITKLWTNFAKTGVPSANDVTWQNVECPREEPNLATTRYLDIGEQLIMYQENLSADRIAFWQNLRQKYEQCD